MSMMKEYLLWLEEKGIAEWDENLGEWTFSVEDIYAATLVKEYRKRPDAVDRP